MEDDYPRKYVYNKQVLIFCTYFYTRRRGMGKFFKTVMLTVAAVVGFNVASGTVQQTHADELQTIQAQHKSGYLGTPQGWFWFENGQKYTGFRYYMGTYYWFINGVRQDSGWRNAWGMTYYTDNQGRAVQGNREINGVAYNFGNNGTFFLRGKSSGYLDAGKGWLWYEDGQRFTGFRNYMGAYYWFQNGVRQQNKWEDAWGMRYYVGADGRTVQGARVIGSSTYYFGNNNTFYLRFSKDYTARWHRANGQFASRNEIAANGLAW